MNVLGIDPGPHVGMAAWTPANDLFHSQEWSPGVFQSHIDGWVRWADVIVYERFVIGGKRGADSNTTIEQIGVLKYLGNLYGKKLIGNQPGVGTKFLSAGKARSLGWDVKGADHKRSAAGHMLLYLVEQGYIPAERVLG